MANTCTYLEEKLIFLRIKILKSTKAEVLPSDGRRVFSKRFHGSMSVSMVGNILITSLAISELLLK